MMMHLIIGPDSTGKEVKRGKIVRIMLLGASEEGANKKQKVFEDQ